MNLRRLFRGRARVIGYNVGDGSAIAKWRDLVKIAGRQPDAIALCEVADRDPLLERFAARFGYDLHQGEENGRGKLAVLVRRRRVRQRGYRHLADRVDVGEWGAGPRFSATRWIAWSRTVVGGRRFIAAASHWPPSVQRAAGTAVARRGRDARRLVFAKCVVGTVRWFREQRGIRVLYVDANATPAYFQLAPLRESPFTIASAASHGRRAIDLFVIRGRGHRVEDVRALTDPGFSSDHRPVQLDLSFPRGLLR